jgi:CoA:oxalate CoA-transferase
MPGILEGIRVLELGEHVSAPFCAKLLADYGADVIKVEPPGEGDVARRTGPLAGDNPHPEKSIPFLYLNANKRGITLNLKTKTDKGILAALLQKVDVVVENFPPAEAQALGLDYSTLSRINPSLVVTSITPFGQAGPYRDYAATDIVTCALSGLMYHSGDSDREPLRNALNQSFYVAGVNGATATLAALFQRISTGQSQQVDVSVMECLATHLVQAVPYYNYMGAIKGRRPVRGSGFEELMPARDGYVIPSVQGSQPWSVVADLIGLEELHDEKFATGSGRIEHGEELKELLIKGLAEWDRKPLFQASGERRLVFGMAQDAGDLFTCPHLRERGFFVEVDHTIAGKSEYPGMGPRLSDMQFQVCRPAPLLGQHNWEIYCDELGYSAQELTQLRSAGVI